MRLTLFRRDRCDLCDMAEAALAGAGIAQFARVEIGWDGELSDRYGWSIPVLRDEDRGAELAWPFDAFSVRRFLAPHA
jgi:hypothetical protein